MKNGLVSIVLPVYNVEKYLDRCIESVVNQTYTNLEVILVDDGSTDGCPAICDNWARRDKRIKVIHKENAGLGMARNTGIENAGGEYIFFFDSDDYVALDTVEKCYLNAKNTGADLVIFGFHSVSGDGIIKKTVVPRSHKEVYSNEEVLSKILPNLMSQTSKNKEISNLWLSACSGMYATDVIQNANWQFVSEREIISEDIYSVLELYKSLRKVFILSEAFYYYCENDASLTHKYRKDRYEKNKVFYDKCMDLCDALGYDEKIHESVAYPYLSNTIGALKLIVKSDCSLKEKKQEFSKIILDAHLGAAIRKIDFANESLQRRILFFAMKKKCVWLCYQLIKAKA